MMSFALVTQPFPDDVEYDMLNVEEAGLRAPGAYTVAPLVVASSSSGTTSTIDSSTDTPMTTFASPVMFTVSAFDERARLNLRGSMLPIALEIDWRLPTICCTRVTWTLSSRSSPSWVDPADAKEPTLPF